MLTLTVLTTIAPMATAQACSCMVPDAARFLEGSDFVFVGSLVERPVGGEGQVGDLGVENVPYTFEVDAVYKGDLRDTTVEVWSASNGAACGFEMPIGETAAIAASLSGGQLTGGLCATFGVDQLETAAADFGIQPTIPQATPPQAPDVAIDQPEAVGVSSGVIALGALAALVVVALAIQSRSRA
jgi:hypothetical protein